MVLHSSAKSMGPAGFITSTASDMSKWLLMMLNRGSVDSENVINETVFNELFTPKIPIVQTDINIGEQLMQAKGWKVTNYKGMYRI